MRCAGTPLADALDATREFRLRTLCNFLEEGNSPSTVPLTRMKYWQMRFVGTRVLPLDIKVPSDILLHYLLLIICQSSSPRI